MAAVYGIAKKHNGHVYVDSEPQKGTTVFIYLPCAHLGKQTVDYQPSYTIQGDGTALIVEDEHLVLDVNRTIVEKLGYRALEARSGREALDIAENYNGSIDFVLLDVILPDMGGNQIYPKLKQLRPGVKVIVCSGFSLDGPAREILDAGAECFLPKPFTVAALAAVLDEIFKK
jgi:CheY-like chemotaxis protein